MLETLHPFAWVASYIYMFPRGPVIWPTGAENKETGF